MVARGVAHTSGFHRTYIGQIERGEKNISFANLVKISSVLGVTLSELLSGLEEGTLNGDSMRRLEPRRKTTDAVHRLLEAQKLIRRLKLQHAALDQTILILEKLSLSNFQSPKPSRGRSNEPPPAKVNKTKRGL